MPNQPKTPLRSFRIADELWAAARAQSIRDGVPLTAVVTAALQIYALGDKAGAAVAVAEDRR